MFSIYILDEFYFWRGDSPQLVETFDKLGDAYGYYKSVCSSEPSNVYDDGVELVYDTDDGDRITLDYYSYTK